VFLGDANLPPWFPLRTNVSVQPPRARFISVV
jgi:hypothetical protein